MTTILPLKGNPPRAGRQADRPGARRHHRRDRLRLLGHRRLWWCMLHNLWTSTSIFWLLIIQQFLTADLINMLHQLISVLNQFLAEFMEMMTGWRRGAPPSPLHFRCVPPVVLPSVCTGPLLSPPNVFHTCLKWQSVVKFLTKQFSFSFIMIYISTISGTGHKNGIGSSTK